MPLNSRIIKEMEGAGLLPKGSYRRSVMADFFMLICMITISALFAASAMAEVPGAAHRYHRDLIRAAHSEWGLDAPIATFAAQIHQESRWKPDAQSRVGAEGLAQFMPATSDWFSELYPNKLGDRQPYNPAWALRALVIYDKWLFKRIRADSPCDKWAMVLSAYNGGLGWVIKDRQLASATGADSLAWFDQIERFNSGRSISNFRENRHYVRTILFEWEPLYARSGWGSGVCT